MNRKFALRAGVVAVATGLITIIAPFLLTTRASATQDQGQNGCTNSGDQAARCDTVTVTVTQTTTVKGEPTTVYETVTKTVQGEPTTVTETKTVEGEPTTVTETVTQPTTITTTETVPTTVTQTTGGTITETVTATPETVTVTLTPDTVTTTATATQTVTNTVTGLVTVTATETTTEQAAAVAGPTVTESPIEFVLSQGDIHQEVVNGLTVDVVNSDAPVPPEFQGALVDTQPVQTAGRVLPETGVNFPLGWTIALGGLLVIVGWAMIFTSRKRARQR